LDCVFVLFSILTFLLRSRLPFIISPCFLINITDSLRTHSNISVGEDVWGLGIASAALIAVCKWAFETTPQVERLYALPFAHNPASRKVLEKGGFTLDAVLRRAAIKDGKVIDMAMYSLLRPGVE
jgi:RimJ/RimL family protein N-acetyltransferase